MLAWLDLEMTGLDPNRHVILEIATLVTDDDLEILAEGPNLIVHQPADVLDAMDDVVRDMHQRSGLLDMVSSSTVSLEDAGTRTLDFLREHIPEPGSVPLCGNSIGTDRRFLAVWLPELDRFLHYRSVDVSTVKELCRRWFPQALEKAPAKGGLHRALDDIRESVEELRYFRRTIFREAAPELLDRPVK
jgi:oligoribonuclease